MNSTCECGCGQVIRPADNDPFFKRQVCQALWMASLSQPEQARSGWRAEHRHLLELWVCAPWPQLNEYYEVDYSMVVNIANGMLTDLGASLVKFTQDQAEDAVRMLAYRYELLRVAGWASLNNQVPMWAKMQQARVRFKTVDQDWGTPGNGILADAL